MCVYVCMLSFQEYTFVIKIDRILWIFIFLRDIFVIGYVYSLERQRQTESENSPSMGMTMPQSLLLHSPLRILGTHAHASSVNFKLLGLVSTTCKSSEVTIMASADPIPWIYFRDLTFGIADSLSDLFILFSLTASYNYLFSNHLLVNFLYLNY